MTSERGRKIFDARVHLFPDMIFRLMWKKFEKSAWPIRYKLETDKLIEFLSDNKLSKMVGICYTNTPGMATYLNDHMDSLYQKNKSTLVPFGTVMPNEEGALKEIDRVLGILNFSGIKIHCHLLNMAPDDEALFPVYEKIASTNKVLNIHCGNFSMNGKGDEAIRRLCDSERFYQAMRRTPNLKVIVPHIGYEDVQDYLDMMDEFPNLYFDTSMSLGGHRWIEGEKLEDVRPLDLQRYTKGNQPKLPKPWKPALEQLIPQILTHPERFLYGSDFPNLPYRWDLEIDQVERYLPVDVVENILWKNADNLFSDTHNGHH